MVLNLIFNDKLKSKQKATHLNRDKLKRIIINNIKIKIQQQKCVKLFFDDTHHVLHDTLVKNNGHNIACIVVIVLCYYYLLLLLGVNGTVTVVVYRHNIILYSGRPMLPMTEGWTRHVCACPAITNVINRYYRPALLNWGISIPSLVT